MTTPSPDALAELSPEMREAALAGLKAWSELPDDERNGERPWIMGFNAGWEACDEQRPTPTDSGEVVQGAAYPGIGMSDADLTKHYEASKRDVVVLVGSEVRQIIGELRFLRDHRLAFSRPEPVGDEALVERLLQDFYLSPAYDPEAERHADVVEAAIGYTLIRIAGQSADGLVEALVERVAKAVCFGTDHDGIHEMYRDDWWLNTLTDKNEYGEDPDSGDVVLLRYGRDHYRKIARAAIQAIPAPATDAGQSADSLVEALEKIANPPVKNGFQEMAMWMQGVAKAALQ